MKTIKTVNEIKRAYTFYLEEKLGKLYSQMVNDNVSLEAMKRNVRNYIYNASYAYKSNGRTIYTKKRWFTNTLNELNSKQGVYFLCLNSVRKARLTEAN